MIQLVLNFQLSCREGIVGSSLSPAGTLQGTTYFVGAKNRLISTFYVKTLADVGPGYVDQSHEDFQNGIVYRFSQETGFQIIFAHSITTRRAVIQGIWAKPSQSGLGALDNFVSLPASQSPRFVFQTTTQFLQQLRPKYPRRVTGRTVNAPRYYPSPGNATQQPRSPASQGAR